MLSQPARILLAAIIVSGVVCTGLLAEGPGQSKLDEATKKKLFAKSADDLIEVAELCEQAISDGLSGDSEEYARDLWSASLYERAFAITRPIFSQQGLHPQWRAIRRLALKDLEKAVEVNPKAGDAHLLIAQLQSLPGGDREKAFAAADQAIKTLSDPQKQATAYVIRGTLQQDPPSGLADIKKALEIDPRNQDAWRSLAAFHLQQNNVDEAVKAFEELLKINPTDPISNQAIAELFIRQKKFDEAITQLDKAIEAGNGGPSLYVMKANVLDQLDRLPEAIAAMKQAVAAAPQDLRWPLMLSRLLIRNEDFDAALEQLEFVLKNASNNAERDEARILRSVVYSAKNRFDEAARDLRTVLNHMQAGNPRRLDLMMQLLQYYILGERPSKAIEIATEIIEQDDQQWLAYRFRGDAFLSIGKHAEAVSDYEAARQIKPDDSGTLNNLAWVLATSPIDEVRDGERAIEIAKKACELTDYKAAHILSTLAAAYAETGNFEEAIKWSKKAVELDPEEKQLEKELESYQNKKPWREMQQIKEKPESTEPNDDDLTVE